MYEFTCLNCGKKDVLPVTSCTPKKFCCRACYREYIAKHRTMPDTKPRINSRPKAAAKAVASDIRKPLVDIRQCKKCVFGVTQSGYIHCGYVLIKGTTRTALHPDGLTSTCYEFVQKQRKHRYQAPMRIK